MAADHLARLVVETGGIAGKGSDKIVTFEEEIRMQRCETAEMDKEAHSTLSVKKNISVPRLTQNLGINLRTEVGSQMESKNHTKTILPFKTHDHLAYF